MKKGEAEKLIYEAFEHMRTVIEAKRYILEKYHQEVGRRTFYHHIDKIKQGNDSEYSLKGILTPEGTKYQFMRKKDEQNADVNYLRWIIETYPKAFKEKDVVKLHIFHKDIFELCLKKTINDEQFIDFLLKQAKKPYESFGSEEITLDMWGCLVKISERLKKINDPVYKKLKKLDVFFKNVVLDDKLPYGVERLEAYQLLIEMNSPLIEDITFRLLAIIDPQKRVNFSPSSGFSVNEFELFRGELRRKVMDLTSNHPEKWRKKLIEILDYRKQHFKEDDVVRELILSLLEETRMML